MDCKGIEMGKCNALWSNKSNCSFCSVDVGVDSFFLFAFWLHFMRIETAAFQVKTMWAVAYYVPNLKWNMQTQNDSFREFVRIHLSSGSKFFDKTNSMEPVAVEKCVVLFCCCCFSACDYIKNGPAIWRCVHFECAFKRWCDSET